MTTQAKAMPGFSEATRQTPARPASMESDVWVPMVQSLLTGVLVGGPIGGLIAYGVGWPWWSCGLWVGATVSVVWLHRLDAHTRALWMIERIIGQDLDGDNRAGPPDEQSRVVEAEVSYRDEHGIVRRIQYADVFPRDVVKGVNPRGLEQFINAALEGKPLTEEAWTGGGKPFSLRKFRIMMQTLERGGLMERMGNGSNQPRQLSRSGRAVFARLAGR